MDAALIAPVVDVALIVPTADAEVAAAGGKPQTRLPYGGRILKLQNAEKGAEIFRAFLKRKYYLLKSTDRIKSNF